jgi:hypothetical protein
LTGHDARHYGRPERRHDLDTTSKQYPVAKLLIANQGIAIRASVTIAQTGGAIDSWEVTGYVAGYLNFPMLLGVAEIVIETVAGPTIRGPGAIQGAPLPGAPLIVRSTGPAEIDTTWVPGL